MAACSGSPPPAAPLPAPHPPAAPAAPDAGPSTDDLRVAAIAEVVNRTTAARHDCWAVAAADDFRLAGRVVLTISFGPGGAVERVVAGEDQPGDPALTGCLVDLYQRYPWPPVFEAGTAAVVPFAFAAPAGQYTVRRADVAAATLAGGKLTAQVLLTERNTGNPAAGMSLLVARDGLDVALHRHQQSEVILVLAGEGLAYDLDGPARGRRVGPGDAIYAPPGTAHGLRQVGSSPLELLSVYAPGGAEQRFAGRDDPGTTPVPAREQRAPGRRFPRPRFASLAAAAPLVIAGGAGRVTIGFDAAGAGDPALYLGRIELDPGAAVAAHHHAVESELLFVTRGGGTLTVAGVAYPVAAGDAVQLPPGIEHAVAVGPEGLSAVHIYAPSGPEQRFRSP
jgi:quercetin dioxygenase-like cupin family protein